MILDYYRIFYYVAQYKSFSKAADVMGNNQPNITRCMNILENDLGCKLFIRSNRGVQLTIEGERLFEHVSIAIETCSKSLSPSRVSWTPRLERIKSLQPKSFSRIFIQRVIFGWLFPITSAALEKLLY